MKYILLFFFSLSFFISCQEDPQKEYVDTTICTKDLNEWGHASNCQCAKETAKYDQKIGKCVTE
jgi:hypothetical protein